MDNEALLEQGSQQGLSPEQCGNTGPQTTWLPAAADLAQDTEQWYSYQK